MADAEKIKLGVSSCLLGQAVRYDSGHKLDPYIDTTLGAVFELVPICPEVAIGLGVPRPPIHMVDVEGAIRVRGVADPAQDVTEALFGYGDEVARQCGELGGYLFKSRSPSCGMQGVEVFDAAGEVVGRGPGRFAERIMHSHPALPVEDEARLADPQLREGFIEQVFLYRRWQDAIGAGVDPQALVAFHSRHKFNVLAHDEPVYRQLGRLVAGAGKGDLPRLCDDYGALMVQAMRRPATRGGHSNVLLHLMGFIKTRLRGEEKRALLGAIEQYRLGGLALREPITLLQGLLQRYPHDYLGGLYYLNPDPREWALRGYGG